MSEKQVFSTMSSQRWRVVQIIGAILFLIILITASFFFYTVSNPYKPNIPKNYSKLEDSNEYIAQDTSLSWAVHAANSCCAERQPIVLSPLSIASQIPTNQQVKAVYYAKWDAQSYYSLKKNISKINMILPDWLSLQDGSFVNCQIDTNGYQLIQNYKNNNRENNLAVMPVLKNFNEKWDITHTDTLLNNKIRQEQFIRNLVDILKKYGFQGINLDFEELNEAWIPNYYAFLDTLSHRLHAEGLQLATTFVPFNKQIELKKIYEHSDLIFVEALNQHYETGFPTSIASLKWVEKWINEINQQVSKEKLVLCMPTFGLDWSKKGEEPKEVSYRIALSMAAEAETKVKFNPATYNLEFEYTDEQQNAHKVFFTDAVTAFNQIRIVNDNGWKGMALSHLGSEDTRIWEFYDKDLSAEALKVGSFDIHKSLSTTLVPEDVEYIGDNTDGEILDVVTDNPTEGVIRFEYDDKNHIISNEFYDKLPTSYVIERFGKVQGKKLVLTFDDGPDAEYTPKVLDILKREKVPAAFFVIGKNTEANPEILKRIYNEGHEIGNHTFYHPDINNVWKMRGDAELVMTRRSIESITGASTILYRPPYNPYNEPKTADQLSSFLLAKKHNYLIVSESIDPLDWKKDISADTIFKLVNDKITVKHYGNIILLHDAGGKRDSTLKALPQIIHALRDSGYQFVSLANLMDKSRAELMPAIVNEQRPMAKVYRAVSDFFTSFNGVLTGIFIVTMILGTFRFLFILYFSVKQYRKEKTQELPEFTPPLSIMVPAYNEEIGAVSTIASLLNQNYPDFEIVFIDDGSKDNTYQIVKETYEGHPKVKVLTKPNGGKASALNYGLQRCKNEFVVCIDADTNLDPHALYHLVKPFSNPKIGAVAGNVKVGNQVNLLTHWQSIEYVTAQNFDRMAFAYLNCITVVPGAIGAFRRQAIGSVGWYETDTLAEDCDLTVRIIEKGYEVTHVNEAIAITESPETIKQFLKQRFRWSFGVMQAFWKSKHILFNSHYGTLGYVAFPNILFFGLLFPLLAPIADLTLLFNIILNLFEESSQNIGQAGFQSLSTYDKYSLIMMYSAFMLVDIGVSIVAFIIQKEPLWKLWMLIPQRLVYRPLQYIVLFKSYKKALKGELMGWGVLKRTGNIGKVEVNIPTPNIEQSDIETKISTPM